MQDHEQVIQECREAEQAVRLAMAEALCSPELATLPRDVRDAKAALACKDEIARNLKATIAFEQMNYAMNERWVAAHEDMYGVRKLAQ